MLTKILVKHKIVHITLLLGAALLLLSGCSAGSTNQNTTAVPTSSTVASASALIRHSPSGTVILHWDHTSHNLDVQLALTGLAEKSMHPAMIMAGSCKNPGKTLYALPHLNGTAIGFANIKTTIKNVTAGIPETGWAVSVSNGPGTSSADQSAAITCANVFNPTASTSVSQDITAALLNAFSPNQNVSGAADLTISNKQLEVSVTLKGLVPASKHMAHIHYGSCASQGPIVHDLKTIVANAAGDATSVTLIPNVSMIPRNGWYINVHLGAENSRSQTMSDPIACGDITQFH
ncbi:CHRD domain-containing protein [Ktedonobacteria bacterium brp13]|nr:CHRD domain-containing protein [Ktedonobacteria bacterium brp13]